MSDFARIAPQRQEFTTTGAGAIVELGDAARRYSLQVVGDTVSATAWSVDLEGSLDGVNFDTILTHTTGTGNGKIWFSGNQQFPALFMRAKVNSLTLGSAVKLIVWILGTP